MPWIWPVLAQPVFPDYPGMFGSVRKHDVHTGVDIYCENGRLVLAAEDGIVVAVENFTGPNAEDPSPWWNDTKAILVEGLSGVILYGEVDPCVHVGERVMQGQGIGRVVCVLKKDKGRPMAMLHFELYHLGTRKSVWWRLGETKPRELLDPTELLRLTIR